jgi:hypothetical protein
MLFPLERGQPSSCLFGVFWIVLFLIFQNQFSNFGWARVFFWGGGDPDRQTFGLDFLLFFTQLYVLLYEEGLMFVVRI